MGLDNSPPQAARTSVSASASTSTVAADTSSPPLSPLHPPLPAPAPPLEPNAPLADPSTPPSKGSSKSEQTLVGDETAESKLWILETGAEVILRVRAGETLEDAAVRCGHLVPGSSAFFGVSSREGLSVRGAGGAIIARIISCACEGVQGRMEVMLREELRKERHRVDEAAKTEKKRVDAAFAKKEKTDEERRSREKRVADGVLGQQTRQFAAIEAELDLLKADYVRSVHARDPLLNEAILKLAADVVVPGGPENETFVDLAKRLEAGLQPRVPSRETPARQSPYQIWAASAGPKHFDPARAMTIISAVRSTHPSRERAAHPACDPLTVLSMAMERERVGLGRMPSVDEVQQLEKKSVRSVLELIGPEASGRLARQLRGKVSDPLLSIAPDWQLRLHAALLGKFWEELLAEFDA